MDDDERQGRMRRWGWAACVFVVAFVAAGVVRVATTPAQNADVHALEELADILDEVPPPTPESAPPRDVFGHLGDGTHEPVPPPTFPRGVQGVVASTHAASGRVVIDRGACRTAPVESVVIRDGGSGLRGEGGSTSALPARNRARVQRPGRTEEPEMPRSQETAPTR